MTTSIGIIGLGDIGEPVARHFLAAGYDVTVTDLRDEPIATLAQEGATPAASPRELADKSELVFILVDEEAGTESVVRGEEGLTAGSGDLYVIISSTVSPELCQSLAEDTPDRVRIADAPVCRGADAARRGELLVLVGADLAVFEKIEPVLKTLAKPGDVHHMGGLGYGQVAKIANNFLLWTALVADAEIFELCRDYGLDIDELTDVISKSSGTNWGVEQWTVRYPKPLPWGHKDMRIAIDMAERRGQTMPLGGLVRELVRDLQAEWNSSDDSQ